MVYRKQYIALAKIALNSGVYVPTPEGSYNQKFIACAKAIVDHFATFTPVTDGFETRKAYALRQICEAVGLTINAAGKSSHELLLHCANELYKECGNVATIDGSSIDWRVYQYLFNIDYISESWMEPLYSSEGVWLTDSEDEKLFCLKEV